MRFWIAVQGMMHESPHDLHIGPRRIGNRRDRYCLRLAAGAETSSGATERDSQNARCTEELRAEAGSRQRKGARGAEARRGATADPVRSSAASRTGQGDAQGNIRDGAKWRYRRDAAGARGERAQADGGFHPCRRSRRLLEEEFGGRRGARGARSVLEYSVPGLTQIRPGQGRDLYLALSRRDGLDQAHPGARGRAFPDRAGRQGGGDEKERQIFLLSPRRLADRRLAVFPSIALGQRRAEADQCTRGVTKFAVPHGDIAPEDRSDRPALHIAAGKGRPTTFRGDPVVGDGLLQFQIDDGEIGVIAYRDAALA